MTRTLGTLRGGSRPGAPCLKKHRAIGQDRRQDTENQLLQLRDYCGRQGWQVVGEYVDHETGGTSRRPKFQHLFRDARQSRFDLVLFWSLDRFSREGVRETLNHLQRLTDLAVGWKSFTEEYLDSCGIFREAVIGILAAIAKQEQVRRSERARAAIERLRRQGKTDHLGRPRLVVDRAKARQLYRQGLSVGAIASKLAVSPATAHRIVRQPPDKK